MQGNSSPCFFLQVGARYSAAYWLHLQVSAAATLKLLAMEKMQGFIEFIFFEVWCKAPGGLPYGVDLFAGNPELKTIIEAFHYSDAQGANFFNGHIETIYGLFAALTPAQIHQLKKWFSGVRFHHRLTAIHPFANGNGRHARLLTDILQVHLLKQP